MTLFLSIMLMGQANAGIGDALLGSLDKQKENVQRATNNLTSSKNFLSNAIKKEKQNVPTAVAEKNIDYGTKTCGKGRGGSCTMANITRSPTLKKLCATCHGLLPQVKKLIEEINTAHESSENEENSGADEDSDEEPEDD